MLLIAEIFGDCQSGKSNTQPRSGRFRHLAVIKAARDFLNCRNTTPDSWNSSQRSLPSRVRSPTPRTRIRPRVASLRCE